LKSKRYAKSIANAFVFNTFFGGEPRDWAETPAQPFPTVSKRRLTEFLLDKLLPSTKSGLLGFGYSSSATAKRCSTS
jgi:hypothetical protein